MSWTGKVINFNLSSLILVDVILNHRLGLVIPLRYTTIRKSSKYVGYWVSWRSPIFLLNNITYLRMHVPLKSCNESPQPSIETDQRRPQLEFSHRHRGPWTVNGVLLTPRILYGSCRCSWMVRRKMIAERAGNWQSLPNSFWFVWGGCREAWDSEGMKKRGIRSWRTPPLNHQLWILLLSWPSVRRTNLFHLWPVCFLIPCLEVIRPIPWHLRLASKRRDQCCRCQIRLPVWLRLIRGTYILHLAILYDPDLRPLLVQV